MPHLLISLLEDVQFLFEIIAEALGHVQGILLFLLDEFIDSGVLHSQLILKRFVASFQIIDGEIALFKDSFHRLSLEREVRIGYPWKGLQRTR